jgi:hypothetical protein
MSLKRNVDEIIAVKLPVKASKRNQAIVESGLRARPQMEQIVNYLEYGQEKVNFPDRQATFIRNHPFMTQMDFYDMQEEQEYQWEEQNRKMRAQMISQETGRSAAEIRSMETQTDESGPADVNMGDGGNGGAGGGGGGPGGGVPPQGPSRGGRPSRDTSRPAFDGGGGSVQYNQHGGSNQQGGASSSTQPAPAAATGPDPYRPIRPYLGRTGRRVAPTQGRSSAPPSNLAYGLTDHSGGPPPPPPAPTIAQRVSESLSHQDQNMQDSFEDLKNEATKRGAAELDRTVNKRTNMAETVRENMTFYPPNANPYTHTPWSSARDFIDIVAQHNQASAQVAKMKEESLLQEKPAEASVTHQDDFVPLVIATGSGPEVFNIAPPRERSRTREPRLLVTDSDAPQPPQIPVPPIPRERSSTPAVPRPKSLPPPPLPPPSRSPSRAPLPSRSPSRAPKKVRLFTDGSLPPSEAAPKLDNSSRALYQEATSKPRGRSKTARTQNNFSKQLNADEQLAFLLGEKPAPPVVAKDRSRSTNRRIKSAPPTADELLDRLIAENSVKKLKTDSGRKKAIGNGEIDQVTSKVAPKVATTIAIEDEPRMVNEVITTSKGEKQQNWWDGLTHEELVSNILGGGFGRTKQEKTMMKMKKDDLIVYAKTLDTKKVNKTMRTSKKATGKPAVKTRITGKQPASRVNAPRRNRLLVAA